jgi:general nucleoside transport system permease protein
MEVITGIIATAFLAGGVIALAALGEVLAERVGVVNLGVEGVMSMGAITAIVVVTAVPDPFLAFAAALAVGMLCGFVFAIATVYYRANQVLCGLALTLLGTGLSTTIGKAYAGLPARATFEHVLIPYLSNLPIVGRALFSQNILIYLIFLILPFAIHDLMFKTRHGLNMRAVGENAAAADAAGIPVLRMRFWYVSAGAALAGGAGAYLTLAFVPGWSEGVVAGRGWIAVALVIFAGYRPWWAVLAAFIFGVITSIGFVGQARNWPVAPAVLSMLPYLGTVAFIIVPALAWHKIRQRTAAPAALGTPYFRDMR